MASEPRRAGQLGTETNLDFRIEKRAGYDTLVWNDTGCRPATEPEVQLWELLAAQPAPAAAPGIDLVSDILTDLSNVAGSWVVEAAGASADAQNDCAMQMHEAIERWSNKLQLGDASPKGVTFRNYGDSEAQFIADEAHLNCPACGGSGHVEDSPKGGSDPWRGLYASERMPNRDEYGCFYHPDIPSWDDDREESIAPLLKAQGFDSQCVPGDFSDEAMEEGGERYWQEMRSWNPEPEGDGWRLVSIYDTEDGPYAMFVKPMAQASDAEANHG